MFMVMGESMRKKWQGGERERDVGPGGVASHQVEEKGQSEMTKIHLHFFLPFFWVLACSN